MRLRNLKVLEMGGIEGVINIVFARRGLSFTAHVQYVDFPETFDKPVCYGSLLVVPNHPNRFREKLQVEVPVILVQIVETSVENLTEDMILGNAERLIDNYIDGLS